MYENSNKKFFIVLSTIRCVLFQKMIIRDAIIKEKKLRGLLLRMIQGHKQ